MKNLVTAIIIVLIAATIAVLGWLGSQKSEPDYADLSPAARNVLLQNTVALPSFSLTGKDGKVWGNSDLKGNWTLLFFGYTHCPDICPTTLWTLQQMIDSIKRQAPALLNDTVVNFISVDPKRDTPDHLNEYIRYFNPDFMAATGDKNEIDKLVKATGAVYIFDGDTSKDDYIVNHSATVYLIDPEGELHGRFLPPHDAATMANNYIAVRQELTNP